MCENGFPPILLYDTKIDRKKLLSSTKYRNIGHLIFDNESAVGALKLCGAEERLLKSGSNYEKFAALCAVYPALASSRVRRGIDKILEVICGERVTLSPYFSEELWNSLNAIIEENDITAGTLLEMMGLESICTSVLPFTEFEIAEAPIDIYANIDLTDPCGFIASEGNRFDTLEEFISALKEYALTLSDRACAIKIALGKDYRYLRCSRKHVLYDIYSSLRSGRDLTNDERNSLLTYLYVELSRILKDCGLNLIAEVTSDIDELDSLLSYLKLNDIIPDSMLILCDDIRSSCAIAEKYTSRNAFGSPSIVISSDKLDELSEHFPVGLTLEYQKEVNDIISAAALISKRDELEERLSLISDEPDGLYEDIVYTNIKNRMRI